MARLPDFAIIGSQRCGTTSLYAALAAHPDISTDDGGVLSEIHFFSNDKRYKRGAKWYKERFNNRTRLVGEKSPTYLQHYLAPRRMKRICPRIKLIVMLRNPIDRAYSNYHKASAKGFVQDTFEQALFDEIQKKLEEQMIGIEFWNNSFWGSAHHLLGFLERGHYADHLKRWFEFFPRRQFLIIRSEDFFEHRRLILQAVCAFLNVAYVETQTNRLQRLSYPKLSKQMKFFLGEYYEQRNQDLYKLLGYDMDWK